MESHDLWIFKTVAEMQSVSKAAEKLGYVQSNISQRIKSLEDELGVKILLRNNRGVTLTDEGDRLLEYANQILLLMDEAKSSINPTQWRENLTIGATQTISAVKIPQLFSSFLREYQAVDVKLKTNKIEKLLKMLNYGELDGIFINGPFNDLQYQSVYSYEEKMVFVYPNHWEIDEQQHQTLIVNSDPNCIYRNHLLLYSKKNNFIDPPMIEFDSLESILQAVHDGLGISIIPSDILQSRTGFHIHVKELPETVKVDFLIKQRRQQPQSLKNFVRFLRGL